MARKHCEHWYWDTNLRHHYRLCTFCSKRQYNYTGEWKDEIRFGNFIEHWTPLGSTSFETTLRIEACQMFEYQTYESWNSAFKVIIGDETFGPFPNLNCADNVLRRHFTEATS